MIKKRIREILKEGKKIETEYLKLFFKKRDELKIGFIINSKIGYPVKRNKVKRIIREIVRNYFKEGDFIFVLKKEIINKDKEVIKNVLEKIKNEIGNSIN